MHRSLLTAGLLALLATGCRSNAPSVTASAAETVITIDPSQRFQTFKGWETALLGTIQDYIPQLPVYPALLEMAANDLGITRIRFSVNSGTEHPPGYGQAYINGQINERTLTDDYFYNIINDNDDPNVANLNGFEFALIDWRMDNLVVPYKKLLEARGESLYLYLTYVDYRVTPFEHANHPDEYAEFMLVMFDHLKSKYGFVPNGIDVMNEPDGTPWTANQMGNAVAATGKRLAAAGYHPDFLVASTVDRGKAVSFFESVIDVSGAKPYVTDLSYHCYDDSGTNSRKKIGDASRKYGVGTALNECWNSGNDVSAAHRDLTDAGNTSWQLGAPSAFYSIDRSALKVTLQPIARMLRSHFRSIRPGAVRIGATTNDSSFDPVAFVNKDGSYAVGIVAKSGVVSVHQLPAGTYDISYTTDSELETHRPAVTIGQGESISVTMPKDGTLMIVGTPEHPESLPGSGRPPGTGTPTGGRAVPRLQ